MLLEPSKASQRVNVLKPKSAGTGSGDNLPPRSTGAIAAITAAREQWSDAASSTPSAPTVKCNSEQCCMQSTNLYRYVSGYRVQVVVVGISRKRVASEAGHEWSTNVWLQFMNLPAVLELN